MNERARLAWMLLLRELKKMKTSKLICDLYVEPEPFPHLWERTVDIGRATLARRADYQRQLSHCHRELGFQYFAERVSCPFVTPEIVV